MYNLKKNFNASIIAIALLTVLGSKGTMAQNPGRSFRKYVHGVSSEIRFRDWSRKVNTVDNLIACSNTSDKAMIDYIQVDSVCIGLISNFFSGGTWVDHNKYMIVFYEHSQRAVIFSNNMNESVPTGTLPHQKDLFMPGVGEGFIFNCNSYQLDKTFRVWAKVTNQSPSLNQFKSENQKYNRAEWESNCNIYYEDFVLGSISELVTKLTCLIYDYKSPGEMTWISGPNPKSNYFVNQWSKRN